MTERPTDGIEREKVRKKLQKADDELDSAVEDGRREGQMYWLGRKKSLKELLDD